MAKTIKYRTMRRHLNLLPDVKEFRLITWAHDSILDIMEGTKDDLKYMARRYASGSESYEFRIEDVKR